MVFDFMSLIELKYLAENLPAKYTPQDICELVDIGGVIFDKGNICHNVFDGEDERADFLIFLLKLSESYADYLSIKGQTQEHDYWKDGLLAHATSCSMQGWNYQNASVRIGEVVEQINLNNSYINEYYFPKYESEIDKTDT